MKASLKIDIAMVVGLLVVLTGSYFLFRGNRAVPSSSEEQKFKQRLEAVWSTWLYNGTLFPEVAYRDAITQEAGSLPGEDKMIVLALGSAGCNPCQIRELRNLDTLYQRLDGRVPVVALYYNENHISDEGDRNDALQLRRVGHASYPILYTQDAGFADYMATGRFPMIFLLDGRRVVSSFSVVSSDDRFSYAFMQALYHVLEGPLSPPDLPDPTQQALQGKLDDDWSIRSLSGEEVTLADFRGSVTLVNLWATWCGPCIAEMPTLQALYDSMAGKDVALVLVSDENEETVRTFVEERSYTFPVYLRQDSLPELLKAPRLPTTFVFDPTGALVYKHEGAANWNHQRVHRFLRMLTTETSLASVNAPGD